MLSIFILTLFYVIILSSLYYFLTQENFRVFRLFGAFYPSPTNIAKFLPWLDENYFSILIQNKQLWIHLWHYQLRYNLICQQGLPKYLEYKL